LLTPAVAGRRIMFVCRQIVRGPAALRCNNRAVRAIYGGPNGDRGMKKEYVKPTLAKRELLARVAAIIANQSGDTLSG
jgi:hypothetical protein